jgi:3-oxocholest-4-en-26-oyl-CoA dehydrogenase alpha subunit
MADDVRAGISRQLSALYVDQEAARWLTYQALALFERGKVPSVETAVARVHSTLVEQAAGRAGLEILGCLGRLRQGDPLAPLDGAAERQWLHNIPASIVAGTLEVQKNIIAKQGLGLPGELRKAPAAR